MDHGSHDPEPNTPAVRASDAERHETARILQQAFSEGRLTVDEFDARTSQAYQAQFRNELATLTVDLSPARRQFDGHPDPRADADRQPDGEPRSGATGELHPEAADDRAPLRRVTGETGTSASIAVMSGCDRSGVWTIAGTHTTVAFMGGVSIDLRRARLQSGEITIRAFAVWGGIEIVVPDDLHLVMDGFGLMGGFAEQSGTWKQDSRPVRQAPPGAPTVRVTGLALMGGVSVRRVPRPEH
ncbi:MAG TPA: DUF1707 domain-containing protein [Candidatus Dietzia intestinigallinarum]|nr:DUF1707 domain-containing protein [Candidatus Dietzia intestinigallinarum]